MNIRTKIVGGFVIVYSVGLIVGLIGLYAVNRIAVATDQLGLHQNVDAAASATLAAHYEWHQNLTETILDGKPFTGSLDPESCSLGKWISGGSSGVTDEVILSYIEEIQHYHTPMHQDAETALSLLEQGRQAESLRLFHSSISPNAEKSLSTLSMISARAAELLDKELSDLNAQSAFAFRLIIIVILAGFLLSATLAIVIVRGIMNPIRGLSGMAASVSKGDLAVNAIPYKAKDELRTLMDAFYQLASVLESMLQDVLTAVRLQTEGDIDARLDDSRYEGRFADLIDAVNSFINLSTGNMSAIIGTVQKFADGDFAAKLPPFPGKAASMNRIMDSVGDNLYDVSKAVKTLVLAVHNGDFDKEADADKFSGDWAILVKGLNDMVDAVSKPLDETAGVLSQISSGHLSARVAGDYKGKFATMKDALNGMAAMLLGCIQDISGTLGEVSAGNLHVEITRAYIGDFSAIKESINAIVFSLRKTLSEVNQASEQLLDGAKQVSESAMQLSDGSNTQASSIQQLSASIETINEKTQTNAGNAMKANDLSVETLNSSQKGIEEMKILLGAISGIEAASNNIAGIIKVIEDISFQTNLLALNAAVEAARAGQHGKGFAVVAEEVRSLATRSAGAAKETEGLIQDSIEKVNAGTRIANATSESLDTMLGNIRLVTELMADISSSSQEQAEAVYQMSAGLEQVSDVVQSNSSTAQESAATAQELNSQVEMLHNTVSFFRFE